MPPRPREAHLSAAQLKSWRRRLKLSQAEAASLLGIASRTFINLETNNSGKGKPAAISKPIALACVLIENLYKSGKSYQKLVVCVNKVLEDIG